MNKIKTLIVLFQIILYSSNITTSMTRYDSFNQPATDPSLIPSAKDVNNDSFSFDSESFNLDTEDPTNRTFSGQDSALLHQIPLLNTTQATNPSPKNNQLFTADSLLLTRNNTSNFAQSTSSFSNFLNRIYKNTTSFFSDFSNQVSNTHHKINELIVGKKFEDEYWKIFNIDKTLQRIQSNINNEKESQSIIAHLIANIKNEYLDAIRLVFNKYFSVDQKIMKIIEQYLEKGITITAFPNSSNILITTSQETLGKLDPLTIPSKDLSVYDPSFIDDIEKTWLLNLHINNINSDFMYAHFNYLKSKLKLYSIDEIIEITKALQSNIHYLYEEDIDKLKQRFTKLVPFIIEKIVNQTPEIDKILFSTLDPQITEILLKKDTAETIYEKTMNFTKKLEEINKLNKTKKEDHE